MDAVPLISKYAGGRVTTLAPGLNVEEAAAVTVKATPGLMASNVIVLPFDVTLWLGKMASNQLSNCKIKLFGAGAVKFKVDEVPEVTAV